MGLVRIPIKDTTPMPPQPQLTPANIAFLTSLGLVVIRK